ncbi:MAG: lysoplasmalogenase [Christensenellaceae bacterium]|jgi:hypothetical protein|nr:lysoplasmalogenase [Christensenellaceae bacterium]
MTTLELVLLIVLPVLVALLAAFFLLVRVTKEPIYGLLAKILPSVGFVLIGVIGMALRSDYLPYNSIFIILGLVFGLVGDIVLDLKRAHSEFEDKYLMTGMISFFAGHIAYLIAFFTVFYEHQAWESMLLPALVSLGIAIVIAPITIIVSQKYLKANFGKFKILSLLYAGILMFLTVLTIWFAALDTTFIVIAVGMFMFLASDLILSQMYFVEGKSENKLLVILNHSAYYAAQILVALSLFII